MYPFWCSRLWNGLIDLFTKLNNSLLNFLPKNGDKYTDARELFSNLFRMQSRSCFVLPADKKEFNFLTQIADK
jgi:hypothetical protein